MFLVNSVDRWVKVFVAAVLLTLEYVVRLWVSLVLRIFPVSLFTRYVSIPFASRDHEQCHSKSRTASVKGWLAFALSHGQSGRQMINSNGPFS